MILDGLAHVQDEQVASLPQRRGVEDEPGRPRGWS